MKVVQVDAFTDRPYRGNPAAVCFLDDARPDSWMQDVAREMNLSETAFVRPREAGGFDLRWFAPVREVDLCGHATLASAHALWEDGRLSPDEPAVFHTRSGVLTARKRGTLVEMDFPSTPADPVEPPPGIETAVGAKGRFVGQSRFDLLLEVESEEVVRGLRPDFRRLADVEVRGVVVTARSADGEHDFVSRFFAPRFGIDEDPVTGSAHCCLAPFWASRTGKFEMVGFQASARGGVVRVRLDGDRVILGGHAITVLRGDLIDG